MSGLRKSQPARPAQTATRVPERAGLTKAAKKNGGAWQDYKGAAGRASVGD